MNKRAVYVVLIAVLLPLMGYFVMKGYSKEAMAMPRHYIYDSVSVKTVDGKEVIDTIWHKIPDFTLTNQLGHQVSLKDVPRKIIVADFFFTHCPTICPKLTANMKRVHDGMHTPPAIGTEDPNFVQFISFSIDPERDSVAALKKWADRFQINPDNWWLLTGDKKTIYDMSIDHMKLGLIDGERVDTNFVHTDYVVLIDKNRNIRGYYHGLDTTAMAKLSKDIVFLMLEKDKNRKSIFSGQLELIAVVFLIAIIGIGLLMMFLKKESKQDETLLTKK